MNFIKSLFRLLKLKPVQPAPVNPKKHVSVTLTTEQVMNMLKAQNVIEQDVTDITVKLIDNHQESDWIDIPVGWRNDFPPISFKNAKYVEIMYRGTQSTMITSWRDESPIWIQNNPDHQIEKYRPIFAR